MNAMRCRNCATSLERPGDFCLVCRTPNTETVLVDIQEERAEITLGYCDEMVAQTTVTTVPEDEDDENRVIQIRNYAGKIVDEVRRKRPEKVYARGVIAVIREIRSQTSYDVYRVDEGEDPESIVSDSGTSPLDVVETNPLDKIGGKHSTLIGGREGMGAVNEIAGHPHVKKIVPGPITAAGKGSRDGFRAKVTRPDNNGNIRLLLRNGSSVQENRVVTTARDMKTGRRVAEDLNEELSED